MPSGTAIFDLKVKVTNRTNKETGKRQSAIAAAAYRSGENLHDIKAGKTEYYAWRGGVHSSEILAPEGSPDWVYERSELWNRHEAKEIQHNAQIFREVRVALPKAFTADENKELTRSWALDNFVSRGMIADISYHDMEEDDTNPHAHIMLTMRHIEAEGFGNKNRDWNNYNPRVTLPKELRAREGIIFPKI